MLFCSCWFDVLGRFAVYLGFGVCFVCLLTFVCGLFILFCFVDLLACCVTGLLVLVFAVLVVCWLFVFTVVLFAFCFPVVLIVL